MEEFNQLNGLTTKCPSIVPVFNFLSVLLVGWCENNFILLCCRNMVESELGNGMESFEEIDGEREREREGRSNDDDVVIDAAATFATFTLSSSQNGVRSPCIPSMATHHHSSIFFLFSTIHTFHECKFITVYHYANGDPYGVSLLIYKIKKPIRQQHLTLIPP